MHAESACAYCISIYQKIRLKLLQFSKCGKWVPDQTICENQSRNLTDEVIRPVDLYAVLAKMNSLFTKFYGDFHKSALTKHQPTRLFSEQQGSFKNLQLKGLGLK